MKIFSLGILFFLMLTGLLFFSCARRRDNVSEPAQGSEVSSAVETPSAGDTAMGPQDVALSAEEIAAIREKQLTIGLNLNHRTDDFINLLIEGAEKAAEEYGIELLVSEAGFDANRQLSQVENLIQQEVDAVFMIAVDSDSISPAILQMNEKGIPVIVVGGPPARGDVLSILNSTSYEGTYASTKALIQAAGGEGEIGIISIPLALKTIQERDEGAQKAIEEAGMTTVGMQAVWTQEEAYAAAENMITANPDIKAVFATWSLAVNGALAAIEDSGKGILLSGYDADKIGFQALHDENPHLISLSGQQGVLQGRAGIDALAKAILQESVAEEIHVPTLLVDKNNYRERWDDLFPGITPPWN